MTATRKKADTEKNFIIIEEQFDFVNLLPEVASLINTGDTEKDSDGSVIGEVIWKKGVKTLEYRFDVGVS